MLKEELLKEYEDLWKNTPNQWVLVPYQELPKGYLIYNQIKKKVLLIRREETAYFVKDKMLDKGNKIAEMSEECLFVLSNILNKFEYMWTTEKKQWVITNFYRNEGEPPLCMPVRTPSQASAGGNDEEIILIIKKMIEHGIKMKEVYLY